MGESPKGIPQALHKGKKAVIVSTCSTPWPFNIWFNQTRGVVKALREILKWSGFSIKGRYPEGRNEATSRADGKRQKEM